jgi:hypothetical protein
VLWRQLLTSIAGLRRAVQEESSMNLGSFKKVSFIDATSINL